MARPASPTNSRYRRNAALFAAVALVASARLYVAPRVPETKDAVHFVQGLRSYSLVKLSPHWPGYPVYMAAGKVLSLASGDPVFALHVVSCVASSLTLVPVGLLAALWARALGWSEADTVRSAVLSALLWVGLPGSWLVGSRIDSDPLGLLLALVVLLLSWRSLEEPRLLPWAAAWGGVLLGVRLSYVPLLAPLVLAAWKSAARLRALLVFVATCAVWFGLQLFFVGRDFFRVAEGHLRGHYAHWGVSVFTDPHRVSRPWRLLVTLFLGLSGDRSALGLLSGSAVVALALAGLIASRKRWESLTLPAVMALAYSAWILVSHDVDKPRYLLPLLACTCLLAGIGGARSPIGFSVALFSFFLTVPLAIRHREYAPVEYRAALFLKAQLRPGNVILEPEDTSALWRFLSEVAPAIEPRSVGPQDFLARVREAEAAGENVWAVEVPAADPTGWWPVARFCPGAEANVDPSDEIWIFRHVASGAIPPPPPCS